MDKRQKLQKAEKTKGRKDKRQKRQKAEKTKAENQNSEMGNCSNKTIDRKMCALTFNITKDADILQPNISKGSGRRALDTLAQRELQVSKIMRKITNTVYLDMRR